MQCKDFSIAFHVKSQIFSSVFQVLQARSQDGGGFPPPARLTQAQFALDRKHAFFDAMP